ncbi:hypothetical protein [Bacillus sp. FJAT-29814]|uniref:hypothetical protein n=1 Tax=Bacillus sp. FJAT-29814 TaxID=1729688 RepID=UPI000833340B|nr:hypothetical protein [Bacillus sp. FJAT-29814]
MKKLTVLSYVTGALLMFIGLGAAAAGYGLMTDPSGAGVGLPLDLLRNSPFTDFLIPGIALFLINGVASLIGALLAFKKNPFTGIITLTLGIAMVIWIGAQVSWIGWESWLQPTFLALGLIEIALGFLLMDEYINQGKFGWHRKPHAH